MESVDVPLGVVSEALPCRREEIVEEARRVSTHLLLLHV